MYHHSTNIDEISIFIVSPNAIWQKMLTLQIGLKYAGHILFVSLLL